MRFQRALHGLLGALCALPALLVPFEAGAADKAAAACIQAAEQGQTAQKAGDVLRGRELFAQCAARECPAMLRRDCAAWLEDADHQIPSIVLGAHDPQGGDLVDARASVDGTLVRERLDGAPVALNPGSHVVRFESTGKVPVELKVVLRAGEKNRPILATLAPPGPPVGAGTPAPPPSRTSPPPPAPPPAAPSSGPSVPPGAWVLGGVGLAALGVFGYFGATGMSDASSLRSTCAPGCTDAQIQSVRTKLIVADVSLGVGVVSLVAALWVGIHGLSRARSAAAWELVVAPTPSMTGARAGVLVRF